jgi:hypothetical protein
MENEELIVPDEFEERKDVQIVRNPIDLTQKHISSQPLLTAEQNEIFYK